MRKGPISTRNVPGGPRGFGQHPYRHFRVYFCIGLLIVFVVRFGAHSWSSVDLFPFLSYSKFTTFFRPSFLNYFYMNCWSVSESSIFKHDWKSSLKTWFLQTIFPEHTLILHLFRIHLFIILDPFWYHLINLFSIDLLHRFWTIFESRIVPNIDPLGNNFLPNSWMFATAPPIFFHGGSFGKPLARFAWCWCLFGTLLHPFGILLIPFWLPLGTR